ncbi:MerR family transcriptional regulator [Bacillus pumilus]|uniref:MerR family transcriptional regulator n=1 Tax=Bacillus pumilus TaxID=1408 RepID=UPI001C220578|nr:MerR family transcriptional regulator [Bacillus pumilus]MBU8656204.1 MerR family transcriptional regulator [Bacillus pumilus]
MDWMKIDQVAKRSGLTKRTIRFYEEIGLLSAPKRTEGGVRLYSEDDMEELEKVMQAKEVLGFSLQELQSFMEIGKQLELNKEGYLLSLDPKERLEKLLDIKAQLTVQHQLITKKLETIQSFKKDLETMKDRAAHAIEQLQK